jgi:Domain of unknown function (DUF427)
VNANSLKKVKPCHSSSCLDERPLRFQGRITRSTLSTTPTGLWSRSPAVSWPIRGTPSSLREAGYRAGQYMPREDVDLALLKRTEHATYCPYKGDCCYFSIPLGGDRSTNAGGPIRLPSQQCWSSKIISPSTRTGSMRSANDTGNRDHPPEDGHLANESRTKRANCRRMHVGERQLHASASSSGL